MPKQTFLNLPDEKREIILEVADVKMISIALFHYIKCINARAFFAYSKLGYVH
ncbi:hypothetical protein [Alkaliphilus peptidifermentans]|uniref:Uncharacterized protein n=1 Tax=Alkaliphilus peptidifermentans DSM 18978 TaxID=1120976 RepID=A0A1G5BRL4_9FIRM|nr:hypothetical protein [Alkaliphilus peptidifermentans]SCX92865.1 hypothetical protein SAMN03080606_00503 [Alkaliphilus peptidifermentans DSM 18978]